MLQRSSRAALTLFSVVAAVVGGLLIAPSAAAAPASLGTAAPIIDETGACATSEQFALAPRTDFLVTASGVTSAGDAPHADQLQPSFAAPAEPILDGVPSRVAGTNRYDTAAQLARLYGPADAVVVANGSDPKGGFDALAANFLAGQLGAPIVLTAGVSLESVTAEAVSAVLAGSSSPEIFVMGKEDSVSETVVAQLNALAGEAAGEPGDYVQRIGGKNRYATAAMAVTSVDSPRIGSVDLAGAGAVPTAILASGVANADALAAGPLSFAWGLPVLLTAPKALTADVATVISTLGIRQLIVLGGPERVSDAVVDRARAAGAVRATRVAGANRFDTAARLYGLASATYRGPDGARYTGTGRVFLANGVGGFPDALAVGPLAGRLGAPLLTTPATTIDDSAMKFLDARNGGLGAITSLGATASVGNAAVAMAKAAAGINILAGANGVVAPTADTNAQFAAAAASLPDYADKLRLALTYLPHDGAGIRVLCPQMLRGWENDAAGLTQFRSCDVWMDRELADGDILEILRHEYMHVLQCRADQARYNPGYPGGIQQGDGTAIGGIERGADAGAFLLGVDYLYYVQYGPTAGPLRPSEIATAIKLLSFFGIPYHVG